MTEKLVFPVVGFSGGICQTFESEDHLLAARRHGLKWYKGLVLVDSQGRSFRVTEAVMAEGQGVLGWLGAFLGRIIKIELRGLTESKPVSLEDFKEMVCHVIDAENEFYSSGGDPQELVASVKSSKSHEEVMRRLGA